MLLTLDPSHLLSYTLSPKATFVFERTRNAFQVAPLVDISWPNNQLVNEVLSLEVEVVHDPKKFLKKGVLFLRKAGQKDFQRVYIPMTRGYRNSFHLPPFRGEEDQVVELYLLATDGQGNEVYRWASAKRPRQIQLVYVKPTRWYQKWWVWAISATALAASAGGLAYWIGQEPPATATGTVTFH